jgi:hypothetical protein
MSQTQIEGLREAVQAHLRDGDDGHLLDWVRRREVLRAWRDAGGLGGPGTFIHLMPRKENE